MKIISEYEYDLLEEAKELFSIISPAKAKLMAEHEFRKIERDVRKEQSTWIKDDEQDRLIKETVTQQLTQDLEVKVDPDAKYKPQHQQKRK